MNRRNKLTLIIAGIMTTSLLFGCGSDESSNSGNESTTNEVQNQEENVESNNDEVKQEEVEEPKEVEEEVLVDNEVLKITLKGTGVDSLFGPEIDVEIENKSEQLITVQLREVSINGVMVNPLFSSDVTAGKKALDDITIMDDSITEIVNVEGVFRVVNGDSWAEIGEYSFKAITDESVVNDTKVSGEILLDNEFVTISYVGQNNDSIFGPGVNVEIVNKTDKTIIVQANEVSVDGYMVNPLFSSEVAAGKKNLDDITFMEENLTEIKNVEGKFKIFYSDNWESIGEFDFNIE